MNSGSPVVKHLVLIGGGHSHLSVLRSFGMNPMPGLAITLISRDVVTPYSGSMPAFLTGQYSHDEMHIDLRPLAQFASARIIQAEISEIDMARKLIGIEGRPDIPFDILSLNIGSSPAASLIKGAAEHALAVKPIDQFLSRWEAMRELAIERLEADKEFNLTIIGGGPASVELAFATNARLASDLGKKPDDLQKLNINLVTADSSVLISHSKKVQDHTLTQLSARNIHVLTNSKVLKVTTGTIAIEDGTELQSEFTIFATGAAIPEWPFDAGLPRSRDGFIEVRPTLQTSSHEFVFASGDAATIIDEERPKSGVYAVRQGKILAENLRRFATSRRLKNYFPQRQALALLNQADGTAIASRGDLFFAGRIAWSLKHWIDSRFVEKFKVLPEMQPRLQLQAGLVDRDTEEKLRQHAMRCAGCGAKVSSNILSEVLQDLDIFERDEVLNPITGVEDASRIRLDDGRLLLQSIDYIKAFIDDPWVFTQIAVNHCLSDIYAMGHTPHSALAMVGIPHAEKRYARQQLKEIMQACSKTLKENNCSLLGGHTAETDTLEFGLCVNGFAPEDEVLNKSGGKPGEVLILTKALGTGSLLAADMRGKARHEWVQHAIQNMLISNRQAAEIIVAHGATACTDVTGFGLAGHLLEVLEASGCDCEVQLEQITALPGAIESIQSGIVSSLHADNSLAETAIHNAEQVAKHALYPLLFDPQTAGGLLLSLPEEKAESCLLELQNHGYGDATIIGKLITIQGENSSITLI